MLFSPHDFDSLDTAGSIVKTHPLTGREIKVSINFSTGTFVGVSGGDCVHPMLLNVDGDMVTLVAEILATTPILANEDMI